MVNLVPKKKLVQQMVVVVRNHWRTRWLDGEAEYDQSKIK